MDKKIGKFLLWGLLFCFQLILPEDEKVTIHITNKYQNPVIDVEIGIPFLIMVNCEGFRPDQDIQGLELLQDCVVQPYGSTQSTSYINGKLLEKYTFTYIAIPNKKGPLVLGPVHVQNKDGRTISSAKKVVQVVDIKEHEYTGKEPYLLQVEVEQSKVYIGEKLKIFLRFCYLQGFENLTVENIAIEDVEFGAQDTEWKKDTVTIAGRKYSCKEMAFEIYPKKAGVIVIPSCRASFVPERAQDIGLFGLFGFSNSKMIESYPKQIEVLPLPHDDDATKDIDAVGQFDSVELEIGTKKAEVGEGIIAKMIVHGEGNFHVMHHPRFQAPEMIHFYEGNSLVEENKKIFEWVLQSDNPGVCTIQPQLFTYFDPKVKK